jgi:hypothetical protein
MNPLAVYNAMHYDQRIDGCMMVVDIGAENTDLIIADGETVWLRNIPVGGNAFTEALTKQFKLNFVKAEELKRNAATSKYARQILQTLRPVFDDLVGEIQRSIGFYASGHRDSRIKTIVAMGSTFRLPQLQKYLQNKLQVEVTRVESLSGGAPTDAKQAAMLNENMLSMSAAYGLAVQAFGDAKIQSSLLPAAIRLVEPQPCSWPGPSAPLPACLSRGPSSISRIARPHLRTSAPFSKRLIIWIPVGQRFRIQARPTSRRSRITFPCRISTTFGRSCSSTFPMPKARRRRPMPPRSSKPSRTEESARRSTSPVSIVGTWRIWSGT